MSVPLLPITLTKGEFRQINEALTVAVRGVVSQWLHHVVTLQPRLLNALLHHLHSLYAGHGIKVTVDSNNISTFKKVKSALFCNIRLDKTDTAVFHVVC